MKKEEFEKIVQELEDLKNLPNKSSVTLLFSFVDNTDVLFYSFKLNENLPIVFK